MPLPLNRKTFFTGTEKSDNLVISGTYKNFVMTNKERKMQTE